MKRCGFQQGVAAALGGDGGSLRDLHRGHNLLKRSLGGPTECLIAGERIAIAPPESRDQLG